MPVCRRNPYRIASNTADEKKKMEMNEQTQYSLRGHMRVATLFSSSLVPLLPFVLHRNGHSIHDGFNYVGTNNNGEWVRVSHRKETSRVDQELHLCSSFVHVRNLELGHTWLSVIVPRCAHLQGANIYAIFVSTSWITLSSLLSAKIGNNKYSKPDLWKIWNWSEFIFSLCAKQHTK